MRKQLFTMENNLDDNYTTAVETIKNAILQGQYDAAKGVNRIQLAVYFGIGKYISLNTRNKNWGKGALLIISNRLQQELPGLRGFSDRSLKNMRSFYEEWKMLDANSAIAIAELPNPNSAIAIAELLHSKSSVATDESFTPSPQILPQTISVPHRQSPCNYLFS